MIIDNCQTEGGRDQNVSHKTCDSDLLFDNLVWLTTEEAAQYLRKSPNAIRIMVHKKVLKSRKFRRRLYFKKSELDAMIETSFVKGGY